VLKNFKERIENTCFWQNPCKNLAKPKQCEKESNFHSWVDEEMAMIGDENGDDFVSVSTYERIRSYK
jgi:hypothetical protein